MTVPLFICMEASFGSHYQRIIFAVLTTTPQQHVRALQQGYHPWSNKLMVVQMPTPVAAQKNGSNILR